MSCFARGRIPLLIAAGSFLFRRRYEAAADHQQLECARPPEAPPRHEEAWKTNSRIREDAARSVAEIVETFRQTEDIHGIVVAVSVDGKLLFRRGFGYQDYENEVAASGETRCDIASIGKLITAHLVMLAHDRTDLDFRYWYDLRRYTWDLQKTLRVKVIARDRNFEKTPTELAYSEDKHLYVSWLLTHMSGIKHYTNYTFENAWALNQKFSDSTNAKRMFISYPLEQWPGRYKYSSYGYNMAGALLEYMLSSNYDHLAENELQRLGMRDCFCRRLDEEYFDYSCGYEKTKVGKTMTYSYDYKFPSGGFASTIDDLIKFGNLYTAMFKKRIEGPLKLETVQHMWSRHCLLSNPANRKGLRLRKFSRGIGWCVESALERDRLERPVPLLLGPTPQPSCPRGGGGDSSAPKLWGRNRPAVYELTPSFSDERVYRHKFSHNGYAEGFSSQLACVFRDTRDYADTKYVEYNRTVQPEMPRGLHLVAHQREVPDDDDAHARNSGTEWLQNESDVGGGRLDDFRCLTVAVIANKASVDMDAIVRKITDVYLDLRFSQ